MLGRGFEHGTSFADAMCGHADAVCGYLRITLSLHVGLIAPLLYLCVCL